MDTNQIKYAILNINKIYRIIVLLLPIEELRGIPDIYAQQCCSLLNYWLFFCKIINYLVPLPNHKRIFKIIVIFLTVKYLCKK
jgi:hypothetical protein